MFSFSNIKYLSKHHNFINKRLNTKKAVFLVGGCVRNLILELENKPTDIDVTLAGNPIDIYRKSKKTGLSHFMTEKFGTITFVKKNKKIENTLQYEITPLRTESGYEDFRHPGEINRCSDIILDAKRRDFSINSIYFFANEKESIKEMSDISGFSEKKFLQDLNRDGISAIPDQKLIFIQNHDIINKLFKDGIYHKEKLTKIVEKYKLGINSDYCYFILDPNLGIQDIIAKKLRAVGEPDKRFQEDALRLLRALRFVNVINQQLKIKKSNAQLFDFDKETWNSIKRNNTLLSHVAKERLKDELIKIFIKGDPFGFIGLLDESNLLQIIFPSLYATKHISQPVRYHPFDVYTHTLLTLYELQKINNDYLVRLGMLYHDVGKVAQFGAYKDELSKDEIRAILSGPLNHRKGGSDLVKKDFSALGFSKKEIDEIVWYVANHHKPEEILSGTIENRKKKLRKFLSEVGYSHIEDILDITIADRRGQYNPLQNNSDLQEINELRKLLKDIDKEEGQFTIKKLAINGNDIMKKLNIPAGKFVGELIKKAFDWTLNDIKARNKKKEIFIYLAGYIKNRKED